MDKDKLKKLISPEDKILIYEHAVEELSLDKAYGFCHSIQSGLLKIKGFVVPHSKSLDYTPEILAFEPSFHGIFWFPCDFDGREKRIGILQTLIKRIKDGRES